MKKEGLDMIDKLEAESKTNIIVIIAIIILVIIIIGVVSFFVIKNLPFKTNSFDTNTSLQNNTNQSSQISDLNQSVNETNNSVNQTNEDNETQEINNSVLNYLNAPNPIGSIKAFKIKSGDGEYFCDNESNPEHGIRLYTYKIINGAKNLSEEYIESAKVTNVCNYYNSEEGINYYIKWQWDFVEGADGYRIYQYYSLNTTNRTYNYYVDVNALDAETQTLTDIGLDLWSS